MKPHNNNPKDAFDMCIQQTCPLLYEGSIYKCSSIALLNRVLNDWKQPITNDWKPYTDYIGITPNSSDREIRQFIQNFGRPHKICSMCPTKKDTQSVLNHRTNVISKKQWLKLHT
jgi:hypothetical protein